MIPYKSDSLQTRFFTNELERKRSPNYGYIHGRTATQLFGVEDDKQTGSYADVVVQLKVEEAFDLIRRPVARVKGASPRTHARQRLSKDEASGTSLAEQIARLDANLPAQEIGGSVYIDQTAEDIREGTC